MEEVEIKILRICKESICDRLATLGARFVRKERQINQIFGYGEDGILVRVRTVEGVTTFTTKQSIEASDYKVRLELESPVMDPETFIAQLGMMGYIRTWYLEKDRSIYDYKSVKISIDAYPGIPPFLEIEGDKKLIKEVVSDLGFTMEDTRAMDFKELIELFRPGVREIVF